ncbi:MAG: hypothetical protein QW786_02925, partial [Candidatus Hadarchaeum sp.]
MRLVKIDQVDERHTICVIVAVFLVVVFAFFSFDLAARMEGTSGYVADETWYVISSRNILREIFGVQPSYVDPAGRHNYTVFFKSFSALKGDNERFRDFIRIGFNGVVTKDYEKVPAISVATAEELDRNTIFEAFPQVKLIQSGYWYPDVSGA